MSRHPPPATARLCAAFFSPNIGQNEERPQPPHRTRGRAPHHGHPRQPHRAARPLPDPLDVPSRTAGIRGLRTEVAPGRSREPGAARGPAEEGTVDDAPASGRRAAADHQGLAHRAGASRAGGRHVLRLGAAGWRSGATGSWPTCPSRRTPTCCATPAATRSPTRARTPGSSRTTWGTATSSTPCATRRPTRRGSSGCGGEGATSGDTWLSVFLSSKMQRDPEFCIACRGA